MFRDDSQRRAMFANIFGKNVFSNDKFKGMFKNEYGDRAVVKNLPIEQLRHMRGSYGINAGRLPVSTSDFGFSKFCSEKRELYGNDLYYEIDENELFDAYVRKKEQELRDEGLVVTPSKVRAVSGEEYEFTAEIPYRHTSSAMDKEKDRIMVPFNTSDLGGDYKVPVDEGDFEDHESAEFKDHISAEYDRASDVYLDNLAREILERKETVPIVVIDKSHARDDDIGEGRHRILAMEKLGYKEMPVAVEVIKGEPVMSKRRDLYWGEVLEAQESVVNPEEPVILRWRT